MTRYNLSSFYPLLSSFPFSNSHLERYNVSWVAFLKKGTFVYRRRESIVGVGRFLPWCVQRTLAAAKKHCAKCVTAAVLRAVEQSLSLSFSPPFSLSLLLSVPADCFDFFVPVSRSARFAYLPETRRRYSSHVLDPRRTTIYSFKQTLFLSLSLFFSSFTGLAFASEHRCCARERGENFKISKLPSALLQLLLEDREEPDLLQKLLLHGVIVPSSCVYIFLLSDDETNRSGMT